MKTLTSLLALLVISSVAAHAQLISYNAFGDMTGKAVLGSGPSDQWNQTGNAGAVTDAVDSAGNTDAFGNGAVTLTLSNFIILVDSSTSPQPVGDGPLDGPSPSHPLAPDLFTDYSIGVGYSPGNPSSAKTIAYTGLADNTVYTLDLYSRNQPGSSGREFTVTAPGLLGNYSETFIDEESPHFSTMVDTSPTDVATYLGTPVFEGNYITLIVKSDGSGDLTLSLNSGSAANGFNSGGEFDITGAQLEAGIVPEPGTVSMMAGGLGMLALLAYRRRAKLS